MAMVENRPKPRSFDLTCLGSRPRRYFSNDKQHASPLAHDKAVVKVVVKLIHDLKSLPQGASDEDARKVFANVGEQLFALSKCPDYIVNRGHYFGTQLNDADKKALIAFLKTF